MRILFFILYSFIFKCRSLLYAEHGSRRIVSQQRLFIPPRLPFHPLANKARFGCNRTASNIVNPLAPSHSTFFYWARFESLSLRERGFFPPIILWKLHNKLREIHSRNTWKSAYFKFTNYGIHVLMHLIWRITVILFYFFFSFLVWKIDVAGSRTTQLYCMVEGNSLFFLQRDDIPNETHSRLAPLSYHRYIINFDR